MRAFRQIGATLGTLCLVACSSEASTPSATTKANPCATPGATYLSHFVEQSGGTCGPLADVLVTVNKDGTVTGPPVSCQDRTETGCRTQTTDCTTTSIKGLTCHFTTDVTYTSDGSSGAGSEVGSCAGGASTCTSSYQVTVTRR